jgi:hypothetical protein
VLLGYTSRLGGRRSHTPTGRGEKTEPEAGPIFSLHFDPEDGGKMLLGNVGVHLQDFTVAQPRRPQYETLYILKTIITVLVYVTTLYLGLEVCSVI